MSYRQLRGKARKSTILSWWQEKHGYLSPRQRQAFYSRPELVELSSLPAKVVYDAIQADRKLAAILERAKATIAGRPQAMTNPPDSPVPRDVSSRSNWSGSDVVDFEAEQRRAVERKLARLSVDKPEPYN